jgi:hypothetical protein
LSYADLDALGRWEVMADDIDLRRSVTPSLICTDTQCVVHRPAISIAVMCLLLIPTPAIGVSCFEPVPVPTGDRCSCVDRRPLFLCRARALCLLCCMVPALEEFRYHQLPSAPDCVGDDFRSLHVVMQDPYSPLNPESAFLFAEHLIHKMFWQLLIPEPIYTSGNLRWRPRGRPFFLPSCNLRNWDGCPYLGTLWCCVNFQRNG